MYLLNHLPGRLRSFIALLNESLAFWPGHSEGRSNRSPWVYLRGALVGVTFYSPDEADAIVGETLRIIVQLFFLMCQ